jgi:hypothetical protein
MGDVPPDGEVEDVVLLAPAANSLANGNARS